MACSTTTSVVIPTRDRVELVRRAVQSVANQTRPAAEIIIVDNASTEPLRESDLPAPVRIIRNDSIQPLAANRNAGWATASSDIVCFLDDDDWYLPEKLADVCRAFEEDPELDFVFGHTDHIDGEGGHIVTGAGPADLNAYLLYRHIHCNAIALRRPLLSSIRFNPEMETYEDVEFIGRLLRGFRGRVIDAPHAVWVRDNRPDRITRRDWPRAWRNTMRLYDCFQDEIDADRDLRRYYHRRLAILSAYMLKPGQMVASLRGWIRA